MTKKLTTAKAPTNGFSTVPGSQMGTKSRAILELLRKGKPRNALDIDMILGMACGGAISRLVRMAYIRKSTYGSATGCYEITTNGRIALGESLSLAPPAYAPITGATMRDPYIPAIHNTSRIGVARA
jgi:hypothetical protein